MGLPRRMPDAPDMYMHMAVSTTWGLSVVVLGVVLLLVCTLESSSWEVSQVRPSTAVSASSIPMLSPVHSMDGAMRGMVMLHTVTGGATRTAVLTA